MLKWLVILVVIAAVGFGARWAWMVGWPQLDQPAATGGAIRDADRANWDQASGKLTRALTRAFPVGSSSAEVLMKLRSQGFEPLRQCPAPTLAKVDPQGSQAAQGSQGFACAQNWDPEHALHYSWGPRSPCRNDMAVFWTDNSQGRLTSIQGQFSCG